MLAVERALHARGLKSGLYFTSAARTAELKDVPGHLRYLRLCPPRDPDGS